MAKVPIMPRMNPPQHGPGDVADASFFRVPLVTAAHGPPVDALVGDRTMTAADATLPR